MENKRGFTLIELIAVVIILGIVILIAIPFFSGSLNVFRDDYYNDLNGHVLNSGKEFFSDNRIFLPHKYLESAIVDVNTLQKEKYIDEVRDYNGHACNKLESYVIAVRKSKEEIVYETCIKCLDDNYDNTEGKPYCSIAWKEGEGFTEVIFDNPDPVYIYVGTSRSELKKLVVTYPSVRRCLGRTGICEQEIMRVSGKGEDGLNPIYPIDLDTVNPNRIGKYTVHYKYENYDSTTSGDVIVYENDAPRVNITKTNKVKTGTISNTDIAKTTDYDPNNREDWAQQLNFTFNYSFGSDAEPGLYVTSYQIFFNNRWEDYCIPNKGTNICTKTEKREMDETVSFRSIDSKGHISQFTRNMNLRIDRTKPSCEITTSGTYGLRQWYITDVRISFINSETHDNYGMKPFANANPVMSDEAFRGITLSQIKSNTYDIQKTDTNWITWYGYIEDKANNYQICNVSFKRDATAPICEFTIPGADGDDGWHKMPVVKVEFKTHTDTSGQADYSGVEDYGFNTWNSNIKEVNHTEDSDHVSYHGEIRDMAGNKSTCDISFIKDSTPPTCTAKVPAPDGWEDEGKKWHKMSTVKVEINTTDDNLSGVRDYGIDSWNSGTKVVNHTEDTAGITYTYQIRDKAGNMNTCDVWFKKDSTIPNCSVTTTGTKGNNGWYKMADVTTAGKVEGSFTSTTDNLSGPKKYYFDESNKETISTTTSTADHTWNATIYDKAGNKNTCSTKYKFDNIAPTCVSSGGSTWTNQNVTLTGTCSDTGYSKCVSDITKLYKDETDVKNQTPGTVYDNAGNSVECPKNQTVQIDKTNPSCSLTEPGPDGSKGWYKSSSVKITASFKDNGTYQSGVKEKGTAKTSGSTNGNSSVTFTENGESLTAYCYVKDKAGNSGSNSLTFKKDDGSDAGGCKIFEESSTWNNFASYSLGVYLTNKPVSQCRTQMSPQIRGECSWDMTLNVKEGEVITTKTINVFFTTNSGVKISCGNVTFDVYADRSAPSCKMTKSHTGYTDGVTAKVECSDGSGQSGCVSSGDGQGTHTGLKSTTTYKVKDVAGNETTCATTTVTAQEQKRTKSCSKGETCADAGCAKHKSCVNDNCTCKTYYSNSSKCGCSSWGSYTSSATCGGYNESEGSRGVGSMYVVCTQATSGYCATYGGWNCTVYRRSCNAYRCAAAGCEERNSCVDDSCDCDTYNESISKCGCKTWGNYGSWSNVSSCSKGESNNHSTYTDCQTIYN